MFIAKKRAHGLSALVVVISFLCAEVASSACLWEGTGAPGNSRDNPVEFYTSGHKMLANKIWFNDKDYGTGTLMGKDTVNLTARYCHRLQSLIGQRLSVLYMPPVIAGVTSIASGFRIPSSAPGVAFEISFPDAVGNYSGGLIVARSTDTIPNSGGNWSMIASRSLKTRAVISLVKTGPFAPGSDIFQNKNVIKVAENADLGQFEYRASESMNTASGFSNRLQMPDRYFIGSLVDQFLGVAGSPSCEILSVGPIGVESGFGVVSLPSVNSSEFSDRPGAIEKNASSGKFRFHCKGTERTKPHVSFNTQYRYNNGVDGVGLPSADSDVGIQVLFNGSPIMLGEKSQPLNWTRNAFPAAGDYNGPSYAADGRYCLSNCGDDMSNSNWRGGGAATGDNSEFNEEVTFRYYQTTNRTPFPKEFHVVFNITLDID